MQIVLKLCAVSCTDRVFNLWRHSFYNNAPIYVKGDNDILCDILHSISINSILLPTYSPKLNRIELVFNIIIKRFTSKYSESSTKNNKEILLLLNEDIDSISLDIIFSCY